MTVLEDDLLRTIKGKQLKQPPPGRTPGLVVLLRIYFHTIGRLFPAWAARLALTLFSQPRSRYTNHSFTALRQEAEEFEVQSDGLAIRGFIWGKSGPTVLLVHGWETGGMHLGGFISPLRSLGFRVVTFDGPAHGRSEGTSTNLPHFTAALMAVIRKTGPVEHIIGHSFGGVTSAFMSAVHHDEVAIKKLVLINVPNKLVRILSDFTRYLRIPASVELNMHEWIRNNFNIDPREVEISTFGRKMNVEEVLLVHDKYDQVVPFYNSLEMAHALPNAKLLACEHLGHNRIVKNKLVIARIGQFLLEGSKQ